MNNQQNKRGANVNRKRGIQNNNNNNKNNNKKNVGKANGPVKGRRNLNKNNRNKGNKGKPIQKEKPKSAEDLDMEMDSYWFKAGKGPDPLQAKLDREMDEYQNARNENNNENEENNDENEEENNEEQE
eukprot:TRINITY_DN31830_c0_g1_i1.p1 TRINITY_DN31830_c0_g1~~TRINITY_DN31830_c0_g1_i1.p1  ORF type:complete len:147 (+),score=25.66 TRINITY_DN31830_c0_g1_i1:60-443(+)